MILTKFVHILNEERLKFLHTKYELLKLNRINSIIALACFKSVKMFFVRFLFRKI